MTLYRIIGAVWVMVLLGHLMSGNALADQSDPEAVTGTAPAEVQPLMRKAESRISGRISRLKTLARQDLRAGRSADAYHRLRPELADARGDSEYLGLLAVAAMRLSSYGEAMVIYERLVQVEPGLARWRMGLALAREQLGLESTSFYREALTLTDGATEIRALLEAKLADSAEESLG